ncbi:MAG: ferritin family protein [Promethearchaeota archaeon]
MKKTSKNLMAAFIKESQISIRYELFANVAKKEKFFFISRIFEEFANQEKEYAKWNYIMLQQVKKDESIENLLIEIQNPTTYGTTLQNLKSAINEEENDWQEIYPNFANTADKEGYHNIATRLRQIGKTRKDHSLRFKMLLDLVKDKIVFSNNKITFWKCMECGYEVAIDNIPNDFNCPLCGHLRSYFQRKVLNIEDSDKSYKHKMGWICMECGYEVELDDLPKDWKCISCGRSKEYFKRKTLDYKGYEISAKDLEKIIWRCHQCGNEQEFELPDNWKCSICGYPKSLNNSK